MIDLTPLFQAVIALLAALITSRLIPWIKKKIGAEEMNMLNAATRTVVFAAEQIYGAGKGAEKMEYVISQLEKKGFTVDIDAIEAAVKEL